MAQLAQLPQIFFIRAKDEKPEADYIPRHQN